MKFQVKQKGTEDMKKRIISLSCALICALSLTACQTTPEKSVVMAKDSDRMMELAASAEGGTRISDLGIPDGNVKGEITGANGKLKINIDAEVETPDVDTMPIKKVSMGVFSQEVVTGLFNYLYPDEKPKIDSGIVTKDDILAEIRAVQEQIDESDDSEETEKLKETLEELKKDYQAAPEKPKIETSDGTLLPLDEDAKELRVQGGNSQFNVYTLASVKDGAQGSSCYMSYYALEDDKSYTNEGAVEVTGGVMPEDANVDLSYEDAKKKCDEFLQSTGIGDQFDVEKAYLMKRQGDEKGESYGYDFYYTRKTDGIPVFTDTTISGISYNKDGEFASPWYYEKINIMLDKDGILCAEWDDAVSVGDVELQSAALKSFDEIMDVFETMMKVSYEGLITTKFNSQFDLDVSVNKAKLCLVRVREKDADATSGLLVPAWVFYGKNKATMGDDTAYLESADSLSEFEFDQEQISEGMSEYGLTLLDYIPGTSEADDIPLIVINAIDGSIINLYKAY